jgi:S-(hydroxymethyl)glutathione dehydrogenase/alcohol dehydrogenase
VFNTAQVRPGETVAVVGCGGVGLSAIQAAAISGAERVIAIDRVASKEDLARKLGASDFVDAETDDAVAQVLELTSGGVYHAIESAGSKATIEAAFKMLRPGGTATVCGLIGFGKTIELDALDLLFEKKIQGSRWGPTVSASTSPDMPTNTLRGALNLTPWSATPSVSTASTMHSRR